jgi:hypothetical protein
LTSIIAKRSVVSDSNSAIYNISVGLYRSLESSHQIILEISRKMSPGVDFSGFQASVWINSTELASLYLMIGKIFHFRRLQKQERQHYEM